MNLDFGILWVEDSFNDGEMEAFERRVRESGFISRVKNIPNGAGIGEIAREHQLFHRYDLILLDYRLKDERGSDLAPTIRALFPSTTILFYSGTVDEHELRSLIAEKAVEGVFCSSRARFIERAGSLIDQTAKSLDRLSGMRGLAMRVVAECDNIMKAAVLRMNEREPDCAGRVADLDRDVLSFFEEMRELYTVAQAGTIDDRLNTRAVDSSKLFRHFRRLTQIVAKKPDAFGLNVDQVERLRALRRSTAQYDQAVLMKRNLLGHVTEIESEDGWLLVGSDEIRVSDFPALRQEFASHIGALSEMRNLICGEVPKEPN
ncbi:response regulator [Cereibacter azotoformans]|uniref:response regulator n=1 Tax=Cereibacter azotoformans TaxID=43057 RepID=UPI000C6CCE99|nr:response regulator [Cereibacter azotoformans]